MVSSCRFTVNRFTREGLARLRYKRLPAPQSIKEHPRVLYGSKIFEQNPFSLISHRGNVLDPRMLPGSPLCVVDTKK